MQRKLLTNGNIFKRTDGRWNGVVWYADEQGERKRKSFCGSTKQEVKEKITAYLADFERQLEASDESKTTLEESMAKWLRVFKFPSVERGTYDRLECTAKHQIYPIIGGKVVGDVTSVDIKALLNRRMNEGYACAGTQTLRFAPSSRSRHRPAPSGTNRSDKEKDGQAALLVRPKCFPINWKLFNYSLLPTQ